MLLQEIDTRRQPVAPVRHVPAQHINHPAIQALQLRPAQDGGVQPSALVPQPCLIFQSAKRIAVHGNPLARTAVDPVVDPAPHQAGLPPVQPRDHRVPPVIDDCDFVVTDNVFIKSQLREDKMGDYNWTYEQAVEKYAEYVAGIKTKYPQLKVGMIEAAFRFHWEDKTRFPTERPNPKNNLGDLKALLVDVIKACKAKGTRIDIFQPEYSYDRINNTKNGWDKLKAMEAFCREEGLEFYFLFNDHIGGHDSDKLFHDNVMKCLRSVKSHGLTPVIGTIQSWYKHPMKELPEDKPHTFTYLAKDFIRENKKEGAR